MYFFLRLLTLIFNDTVYFIYLWDHQGLIKKVQYTHYMQSCVYSKFLGKKVYCITFIIFLKKSVATLDRIKQSSTKILESNNVFVLNLSEKNSMTFREHRSKGYQVNDVYKENKCLGYCSAVCLLSHDFTLHIFDNKYKNCCCFLLWGSKYSEEKYRCWWITEKNKTLFTQKKSLFLRHEREKKLHVLNLRQYNKPDIWQVRNLPIRSSHNKNTEINAVTDLEII